MLRRCAPRLAEMVKSFTAADVMRAAAPSDLVFARKLPQGGVQWFSWPGAPRAAVLSGLLVLPEEHRMVHSVFGRPGVPVDVAIDIDAPLPTAAPPRGAGGFGPACGGPAGARPGPAGHLALLTREAAQAVVALAAHASSRGERLARVAAFQSPVLSKVSIHIHAELDGAVFADYAALRAWLLPLQQAVPAIDVGLYRPMGSLRMYGNRKADGSAPLQRLAVPPAAVSATGSPHAAAAIAALAALRPGASAIELLDFSLAVPDAARAAACRAIADAGPAIGERAALGDGDARTGRRRVTPANVLAFVAEALPRLTRDNADDYRKWVVVGMQLKAVAQCSDVAEANGGVERCEAAMLALWHDFSRPSAKYKDGDCARVWPTLRPDPTRKVLHPCDAVASFLLRRRALTGPAPLATQPPTVAAMPAALSAAHVPPTATAAAAVAVAQPVAATVN